MSDSEIRLTFGELEAALASMHEIADNKRTAFQSRLKNFHRFGFPARLEASKGKTSFYSAGQVIDMALALELTQLGLTPERVVRVITFNWFPTYMATQMAASALLRAPQGFDLDEQKLDDPLSMFIFFDPSALSSLRRSYDDGTFYDGADASFFYGGEGVVRDNIVKWTSGMHTRLSMVNVTALIDFASEATAPGRGSISEWRDRFFRDVIKWANDRDEQFEEGRVDFLSYYFEVRSSNLVKENNIEELVALAKRLFDFPESSTLEAIERLREREKA